MSGRVRQEKYSRKRPTSNAHDSIVFVVPASFREIAKSREIKSLCFRSLFFRQRRRSLKKKKKRERVTRPPLNGIKTRNKSGKKDLLCVKANWND